MISSLPRLVPAAPGKPVRPDAAAVQERSRAIAEQPSLWSPALAAETVRQCTELAPQWDGERGGYRAAPLADALDRGGPLPPGLCLELGCGTGLLTGQLTAIWPRVAGVDLTWEMLRRSPATPGCWRTRRGCHCRTGSPPRSCSRMSRCSPARWSGCWPTRAW